MKPSRFLLGMVAACLLSTACTPVKPHERVYLNDPEMQLGTQQMQGFERYVESIREGAMPTGAAKSSGGCGCN